MEFFYIITERLDEQRDGRYESFIAMGNDEALGDTKIIFRPHYAAFSVQKSVDYLKTALMNEQDSWTEDHRKAFKYFWPQDYNAQGWDYYYKRFGRDPMKDKYEEVVLEKEDKGKDSGKH